MSNHPPFLECGRGWHHPWFLFSISSARRPWEKTYRMYMETTRVWWQKVSSVCSSILQRCAILPTIFFWWNFLHRSLFVFAWLLSGRSPEASIASWFDLRNGPSTHLHSYQPVSTPYRFVRVFWCKSGRTAPPKKPSRLCSWKIAHANLIRSFSCEKKHQKVGQSKFYQDRIAELERTSIETIATSLNDWKQNHTQLMRIAILSSNVSLYSTHAYRYTH